MEETQVSISGLNLPTLSSEKTYVLQFDGGSRGNPGSAGAGMVLYELDSRLEVWSAYKYLSEATNNIAEYKSLLEGLKFSKAMGVKHLIAEGDSKLVVNQINGVYKVLKEHLKPLYQEALSLSKQFQSFKLNYIPRAENFRADELANVAMDKKSSTNVLFEKENYVERLPSVINGIGGIKGTSQSESHFHTKVKIKAAHDLPYPNLSSLQLQIHPSNVYHMKSCISSNQKENTHGSAFNLSTEDTGHSIWNGSYFIPEPGVSSNTASYIAIIVGLRCALDLGIEKICLEIKSDLVINQLNGKFRLKSENLIPYHQVATKLSRRFSFFEIIRLKDHNSEAILKSEARKAMKNRRSKL